MIAFVFRALDCQDVHTGCRDMYFNSPGKGKTERNCLPGMRPARRTLWSCCGMRGSQAMAGEMSEHHRLDEGMWRIVGRLEEAVTSPGC
ncbi:hypothetical protein CEXT_615331 [Caerostris extrusa]|uniref:Uncharacterized protein n=1 Tax=Caerostris extrusa TaxID=172846 RepID=A0AAV4RKC0_CAEEX|nr:hypothetical protein CEXT_615331 [Caerostris extrusa]